MVKSRIARRQFRRIAPNREALNENPNSDSPVNIARHTWHYGNGQRLRTFLFFESDMGSNPEFIFLNIYFFKKNKRRVWAASEGNVEVEVNDGCIKQTDRSSYYIWQYFTVSNSSEAKTGGKIV